MNPPEAPLTLTRHQAATRQIEAAIAALEEGHFDLAITLAGAAEGMFEDRKEGTLFHGLLHAPRAAEHFPDRKDWNALLNLERDWLKHGGGQKAEAMQFELHVAALMVARACSKLEVWTPMLEEFKRWFQAWLDTNTPDGAETKKHDAGSPRAAARLSVWRNKP